MIDFDLAGISLQHVSHQLDCNGYASLASVMSPASCNTLADRYDNGSIQFRSTITMAHHNFGRGEYKYFAYPLPSVVADLRASIYPALASIANTWEERLGTGTVWPTELSKLLDLCHRAGQTRPTPLMLRYGTNDFNCLHQDLYGDVHFPLQVIVQLSPPEQFTGGELVLVEQRPRMQSLPTVITMAQGCGVVIPVRDRPFKGARGWRRHQMRHGVSRVTSGQRQTLGLIFHDAV